MRCQPETSASDFNSEFRRAFAQNPSLTFFEVACFQARRVDKSTAGGVSHRFVTIRNLRPGAPTQGAMCRPFRPETQCFCSPVAHATGRGCTGLPALTKMRNFKTHALDCDGVLCFTCFKVMPSVLR
jgi:hypothetical protein